MVQVPAGQPDTVCLNWFARFRFPDFGCLLISLEVGLQRATNAIGKWSWTGNQGQCHGRGKMVPQSDQAREQTHDH